MTTEPSSRIDDAFRRIAEHSQQRSGVASQARGPATFEPRVDWESTETVGRVTAALAAYEAETMTPQDRVKRLLEHARSPDAMSTIAHIDAGFIGAAAADSSERWRLGTARSLEGIVVGVKDTIDVAGLRTGFGLAKEPSELAVRDAGVVSRLRASGAIPSPKLRTYEYAWAEDSGPCPVWNPTDRDSITGGSSNGSAAAVGFGLVDLALGSDTLGSTRAPASFCGVVGLKPTFGSLPTEGMAGLAPSLDSVGLIGSCVADVALMWRALSPQDAVALGENPKVGILHSGPRSSAVNLSLEAAGSLLATTGATVDYLEFDWMEEAAAAGMVIVAVESTRQKWAMKRQQDIRDAVQELLAAGRGADPAVYEAAITLKEDIAAEAARLLSIYDVILSPVVPGPAPKVDSLYFEIDGTKVPWLDIANIHLAWSNLAGVPSLTVPVHLESDGSLTSLQVTALTAAEEKAFAVASILEWSL